MNFLSDSNNRKITICCLLVILICIFFINNDSYFLSQRTNSNDIIGTFNQAQKEVRRKNSFNYFWDDISNKDRLVEGDSVYTGPGSRVVVKLKNGQSVTIEPNSLIKFSLRNKKMYIDIPYGSLKLDSVSKDIVISDCGKEYSVGPDSSELNFAKSEKCGAVQVKTKSTKTKQAFSTVKSSVDLKSVFNEMEESGSLTEILQTKVAEEMGLNTSGVNPADSLVQAPIDPVLPEPSQKEEDKLRLKAPQFSVQKIPYSSDSVEPVLLKWTRIKGARNYRLEISDSPKFITTETHVLKNTEFKIDSVRPNMFFRVRANAKPFNKTEFSAGVSKLPLDPKLGSNGDSQNIEIADSRFSKVGQIEYNFTDISLIEKQIVKNYQAKNPQDQGKELKFDVKWAQVPHVEHYEVDILDGQTNQKINQISTRSPAGVISAEKPGLYKYQVHAIDGAGRTVSSSPVGELVYNRVFNLVAPIIRSELNNMFYFFQNKAAKYIWLRWEISKPSRGFKVEIAKDPEFTSIVKSAETNRLKYLITQPLDNGLYFWRVRSQENNQYSEWSNVQKFKVQSATESL